MLLPCPHRLSWCGSQRICFSRGRMEGKPRRKKDLCQLPFKESSRITILLTSWWPIVGSCFKKKKKKIISPYFLISVVRPFTLSVIIGMLSLLFYVLSSVLFFVSAFFSPSLLVSYMIIFKEFHF